MPNIYFKKIDDNFFSMNVEGKAPEVLPKEYHPYPSSKLNHVRIINKISDYDKDFLFSDIIVGNDACVSVNDAIQKLLPLILNFNSSGGSQNTHYYDSPEATLEDFIAKTSDEEKAKIKPGTYVKLKGVDPPKVYWYLGPDINATTSYLDVTANQSIAWDKIDGKPTAAPADIDLTVENAALQTSFIGYKYVNSQLSNTLQNGTVNEPYKTPQTGANGMLFGEVLVIAPNEYAGNVTITNKHNNTLTAAGVSGQYRVVIDGDVTIDAASHRISMENISINGKLTINSTIGLCYFDNITCNVLEVNSNGYIQFGKNCELMGDITKNGTGILVIKDSQLENNGILTENSGSIILSQVDYVTLKHTGGVFIARTGTYITGNTRQADAIVSTAGLNGTSNALYLLDGSTLALSGIYARINKTGSCPWMIGMFLHGKDDVLNGNEILGGLQASDLFAYITPQNYTTINYTIHEHIKGIDAALGTTVSAATIGGVAVPKVNKELQLPASYPNAEKLNGKADTDFVGKTTANAITIRWDGNVLVFTVDGGDDKPVHSAYNADMVDGKHAVDFFQLLGYENLNIDTVSVEGKYRIGADTGGVFPTGAVKQGSHLLFFKWDDNAAYQLYLDHTKNTCWIREKIANAWNTWLAFATKNADGSLTATAFYEDSDERLKTDIAEVDTSVVERVEFRQYIKNGRKEVGVIAQQVLAHFPEAVLMPVDGKQMMSVCYSSILSAKCALYEKKIAMLEQRLQAVEELLHG